MDYIDKIYHTFEGCRQVSIDSREDQKGKIFFGIKGENFDGNKYAQMALDKGAVLVVVDERTDIESDRVVRCPDTLLALQALANKYRHTLKSKVIAITGSSGKTTTKELLNLVLSKKYGTHATLGNFNNHIGLPLTILSCPMDAEVLILEMGANHHNEIEELCKIGEPKYGLITNIGSAHLEGFGDIEGVLKAKTELFEYLKENNGMIFLNRDDTRLSSAISCFTQCIPFSISSLNIIDYDPLAFTWKGREFTTCLYGDYNIYNIMSVLTIGTYFEVPITQMVSALSTYKPANNRSQVLEIKGIRVVLDAYNANPDSMKASINSFYKGSNSDQALVLGDMKELGSVSLKEHRDLLIMVGKLDWKYIFLVGTDMAKAAKSLGDHSIEMKSFATVDQLMKNIDLLDLDVSEILIKGSRALRLEQIVENVMP